MSIPINQRRTLGCFEDSPEAAHESTPILFSLLFVVVSSSGQDLRIQKPPSKLADQWTPSMKRGMGWMSIRFFQKCRREWRSSTSFNLMVFDWDRVSEIVRQFRNLDWTDSGRVPHGATHFSLLLLSRAIITSALIQKCVR